MELNEFIGNVAAQFDNTDAAQFSADTNLWELEEWSSLIALSIIAMIDEEYNVTIRGSDVKGIKTIAQLFEVVKAKSEE